MGPAQSVLRRTFFTFPGGIPGLGLLLLRATVGVELGWSSYGHLTLLENMRSVEMIAAALALACGSSIVAGYHTALASVAAAVLNTVGAVWWPQPNIDVDAARIGSGFGVVIAIALACLGPGALSVDARLYGHREITIPRISNSRSDE